MTNLQQAYAPKPQQPAAQVSLETNEVPPGTLKRWGWLALVAILIGFATGAALAIVGLVSALAASDGRNGQVYEIFHSRLESRRIGEFSYAELERLKNEAGLFSDAAAYSPVPVTLSDGSWQKRDVQASFVTEGYFHATGSTFAAGADFSCAGNPCLEAILGPQLWQEHFSSDPNVIGRSIGIEGQTFTIRGILQNSTLKLDTRQSPQLWIPVQAEPVLLGADWTSETSTVRWLRPIVQLKTNVTARKAQTEIASRFADSNQGHTEAVVLTPGQANLARTLRIRGGIVEAFGSYVNVMFWAFVLVVGIAINWLAVSFAGMRIRALEFVLLGLAETGIAVAISLIVKRVLHASLGVFGAPAAAIEHSIRFETLCGIAFTLACSGLIVSVFARHARTKPHAAHPPASLFNAEWAIKIKDRRYVLLSAGVLLLVAGYTANGLCVSDFWEHAAVVRELAAHPFNPQHPILPVHAPHAGYSPYALGIGLLSRVTGLSAVDALRLAGILNVLLLVCTLGLFVRAAFPARHTDFYALLFALVLWGLMPWYSSGFIHLNVLGMVASYPATFAMANVFLAWFVCVLFAKRQKLWLLIPLAAIVTCVMLDHPLTAISMFAGLFAITIGFGRSSTSLAALAAVCIAAFLLACAWPYYDIRALLMSKTGHFDEAASGMYPGLIKTIVLTFPALIGLPMLFLRFRANRRDFVVLTFVALSFIYAVGGLTGKATLGRVVPFVVLMLQLAVADWIARYQAEGAVGNRTDGRWVRNSILVAAAIGCCMMIPGFISSLPLFQKSYGEYTFLPKYLSEQNTVLSDFESELRIPAFGPKVAAYPPDHILFFVHPDSDINERFFSEMATDAERTHILDKYRTRFLLLDKRTVNTWPGILRLVSAHSSVLYSDGDMLLLKTD